MGDDTYCIYFSAHQLQLIVRYITATYRVIDGKAGGYTTSWRVNVNMDGFGSLFSFQEEQLGDY